MAEITYVDALNQAIKEEMRRDEKVFIMGESIRGGIYGVTGGLSQEFDERVIDTPLSENGFVGAAVGAAAVGMRPIVQSLSSFLWVAMDQLVSQAAKMRYMFGGQVNLPIVYRCGMNYGNNTAAHHTDRPYSMYMNMPGLKIVIPTTPADAKGLLKTAIRDNDPVMFFEDNNVAGMRGEVPEDEDFTIPFGIADVKREGTDVTVVALAGMVPRALSVADALEGEGVSVEVIDPRTIVPLDKQTILKSVEKTGRLVVVDPAHKSCSVASEISAMVAQEGFWTLQAPVQRVASLDCHFPFSPALEHLVFPNEEKIGQAIYAVME
ncbi:MAG: alpha-ketoacid dehydrogenase subunit beta [Chloroflexi bacterium]|nr:alpha-ketoacid dehydrogenase subunit beta [Chloroflexota bacterium]MCI0771283.1 alpha-ketoacid dehydrogenase subunit beta [Chloroflexota bacterium]MCI0797024.1 alpha-ketoacid dehydrogenase subunit beta [Chloroflexota bacterium]MCI0812886.1 alpha-ketoacid dehydrogenase subunit beta [Chloroflexota bacterium]MCI0887269.1 alpha-ketoacid dehydrogenase subunit beta [Chloroflexota bacterium]